MIDVCSGLETRYSSSGAPDASFQCPEALYAHWQSNYANDNARFYVGDAAEGGAAELPTLSPRLQPGGCAPVCLLTGRVFRQTDITTEILKVRTVTRLLHDRYMNVTRSLYGCPETATRPLVR